MKNKLIATVEGSRAPSFSHLTDLNNLFLALRQDYGSIIGGSITNAAGQIDLDKKIALQTQLQAIVDAGHPGVALLVMHQLEVELGYLKDSPSLSFQSVDTLYVHSPNRMIRANRQALLSAGIFTEPMTSQPEIFHQNDKLCFMCSSPRILPKQLLIDIPINGNTYQAGFTFAPFDNPAGILHFVSWNKMTPHAENQEAAHQGKTFHQDVISMDLDAHTISDLDAYLTTINQDIAAYCHEKHIAPIVIDGVHNGWAGNSILHNHFQFLYMGYNPYLPPQPHRASQESVPVGFAPSTHAWHKGDTLIERLDWPTAAYRISAPSAQQAIDMTHQLASHWVAQQDQGISPLHEGHLNHTQNLYIPGTEDGKTIYWFPRYSNRLKPDIKQVNILAVIEAIGRMLVESPDLFETMKQQGTGHELSEWLAAISPTEGLESLEHYIDQRVVP